MPFLSRAQQRWGNSSSGVKALGGKANVAEWNQATKESSLPQRKEGALRQTAKKRGMVANG